MAQEKTPIKVHPLIAVVVILAAIITAAYLVIPTHNHGPIYPNEMSATGGLRKLLYVQAFWRQAGRSGTGKQDYWTYDVSCLSRMPAKTNPGSADSQLLSIAQADTAAAGPDVFGPGSPAPFGSVIPSHGYLYRAMLKDEAGRFYNQNKIAGSGIACANDYKFGFVAYPVKYGKTGNRVFIINEAGTIYWKDTRGEPVLDWPGEKPETAGWHEDD